MVSGRVAGPSASVVTMETVSLRRAPPPPRDFKLLPFLRGPGRRGARGGRQSWYAEISTAYFRRRRRRTLPTAKGYRHRRRVTHTRARTRPYVRTRTLGKKQKGIRRHGI